jgi:phosphate transport system permease protein
LGASRTQAVFHHVLPLAMPGVMTGSILSMAHALGETAPLLMIGMISFVPGVPGGFTQAATVLPVQVFIWENASERAFHERTAGAIIVLLAFMILMNLAAIIVRRRFERRW